MTTSPLPAHQAEPVGTAAAPSAGASLDLGGLLGAVAILLSALAFAAAGFWISAKLPESRVSALFAAGIVTTGMTIALVIGWLGAGRTNALAATLASGGIRFGTPLVACILARTDRIFDGWFRVDEAGFLQQMLGLYLVGLLVETALVYRRAFRLTNWQSLAKKPGPNQPRGESDRRVPATADYDRGPTLTTANH